MSKKFTFVLDVDGVLTDGTFLYDSNGKAYKKFGADDSDALKLIADEVDIVFVSADHRGFPITKKRIDDMGFRIENVKSKDRLKWIKDNFGFNNTFYFGDSFEDIPMLYACSCSFAPKDALDCVKDKADIICPVGGHRAVADAAIYILKNYLGKDLISTMKEKGYIFEEDLK